LVQSPSQAGPNFGFMTILHETNGYVGGYLVTNIWSRPLEFRLSTAVQPNRIQQILYGRALQPYIFADLIGKALVERTSTPAHMILTDRAPLLELRPRIETPVIYLASLNEGACSEELKNAILVERLRDGLPRVFCHSGFAGDQEIIRGLLGRLSESTDINEPFGRVREAISEARKIGATTRA
jgi:hypothetical protein